MTKKHVSATQPINKARAKSPIVGTASDDKPRRIQQKAYKSFRLSKPIKPTVRVQLSSGRVLLLITLKQLWKHKKVLGGILLVYAVLQLLLVEGVLASDFSSTSTLLNQINSGNVAALSNSLTLLGYLLTGTGQSVTTESAVYRPLLLVICSLAFVWALRQLLVGSKLRIRDGFYKGMYPLIPFILVLLVVCLQFVPLLIGSWLYQTVIANGIAATLFEKLVWILIFGVFAVFSLYMLLSSLFALYIVTLPEMTPLKALRSSRGLVMHRRLTILRKFLVLGLACGVALVVIMLPVILFVAPAAPWFFYVISVLFLGVAIGFTYNLYRELLNE